MTSLRRLASVAASGLKLSPPPSAAASAHRSHARKTIASESNCEASPRPTWRSSPAFVSSARSSAKSIFFTGLVGATVPFPGLCPLGLAAATKMATCARQMACACAEGGAPPPAARAHRGRRRVVDHRRGEPFGGAADARIPARAELAPVPPADAVVVVPTAEHRAPRGCASRVRRKALAQPSQQTAAELGDERVLPVLGGVRAPAERLPGERRDVDEVLRRGEKFRRRRVHGRLRVRGGRGQHRRRGSRGRPRRRRKRRRPSAFGSPPERRRRAVASAHRHSSASTLPSIALSADLRRRTTARRRAVGESSPSRAFDRAPRRGFRASRVPHAHASATARSEDSTRPFRPRRFRSRALRARVQQKRRALQRREHHLDDDARRRVRVLRFRGVRHELGAPPSSRTGAERSAPTATPPRATLSGATLLDDSGRRRGGGVRFRIRRRRRRALSSSSASAADAGSSRRPRETSAPPRAQYLASPSRRP